MSKKSTSPLKNCWEIYGCERHANGKKVHELGECIVSKEEMGHSCWAVAGTLCGGEVQGSVAEKQANCMKCQLYKLYHRAVGKDGKRVKEYHPEEDKKYSELLMDRLNKRYKE